MCRVTHTISLQNISFEFFIRTSNKNIPDFTALLFHYFLHSPRQNSGVYHIVERAFPFRVEINSCPLISAIATQLVLHGEKFSICLHQDFYSPMKKGTNCSPTNFLDIITVNMVYVFKKLWAISLLPSRLACGLSVVLRNVDLFKNLRWL